MSPHRMAESTQRIHPTPTAVVTDTPLNTSKALPFAGPPMNNSRGRSCCCRAICCVLSIVIALLIVLGILVAVFYFVYHPKAPNFSVTRLRITDLRLNLDLSLYAKFDVRVTATNPNEKIAIYYEKGGKMSVWYTNTELCRGVIPSFYQEPLNTTRLDVSLAGQNQYGNTLMSAIQQQQQSGSVPLDLKVEQPVAIRPKGSIKLGKVKVLANCKLMVDSLSSNNLVSIKTSSCSIRVKL